MMEKFLWSVLVSVIWVGGSAVGTAASAEDVEDGGGVARGDVEGVAVESGDPGASNREQAPSEGGQVSAPEIVSAEAWGASPQPIPEERRHTPQFVTIHHAGTLWSAGGDAEAKARGLQAYGQNEKGWPDLPYHYLIAPDGTIYAGRPVEYEPETNTSYEVRGHIGIQLWGNFEEQRVSLPQLRSTAHLTAWLLQQHGLDPESVGGHLDRAETACPGKDLYRYLEDGTFGQWVAELRQGGSPEMALAPPLPDGPTEMIPDSGTED